ncbi:MAG TPA: porin [Planctomycetaceae bacterium]|nr:porin [Planctomycetaceae bacterium]
MTNRTRGMVLCLCGMLCGGLPARGQDWAATSHVEPVVQPTEYQQLVERLNELEAEVTALKAPESVQPANAEYYIPPAPAAELGSMAYGYAQATAPAAPTKPKYPTVNVNGFFQADTVYFSQDATNRAQLGDIQDGSDLRRTRLSASGAVADNVNYFIQMDFGFFGRPTFTDIWGEVKNVPWLGTVRAGQWKQPYSLEVPTSVRYQTFMERSLLFQTFDPFRHIGVGFYNNSEDENWTWAMSGFRVGQDQFGNDIGDSGGWSTAGRLTHLLWYNDFKDAEKRLEYLHLGGAFWFGDPAADTFRYATIPEAFVGAFGVPAGTVPGTSKVQVPTIANGTPPFVDTGAIPTNTFTHLGSELLWVHGPFTWQSEVQLANLAQIGGPQLTFWGYYSEVMLFLTGESRTYNRKLGTLDRITPLRPYIRESDCEKGPGAWELAYRVSYIDLNDQNISGGRLADLTTGLNWYLNGYTKVQFNYIHAALNRNFNGVNGPSDADIYGVRFQVDF